MSGISFETLKFSSHNRLVDWGIPDAVIRRYEKRSVKKMFQWQIDYLVIDNGAVLSDSPRNLIYSAPTSVTRY